MYFNRKCGSQDKEGIVESPFPSWPEKHTIFQLEGASRKIEKVHYHLYCLHALHPIANTVSLAYPLTTLRSLRPQEKLTGKLHIKEEEKASMNISSRGYL